MICGIAALYVNSNETPGLGGLHGTADLSSVKLLVLAALGWLHAIGAHRNGDAFNVFGIPYIFDCLRKADVDPRVQGLIQEIDELPGVKGLCGEAAWASAVMRLEKIALDLLDQLGRPPPRARSPMLQLFKYRSDNTAEPPASNRARRVDIRFVSNHVRDSLWTLIQNDDGTLHVEQKADYPDGDHRERTVPINDFMKESGPPPRWLQELIDRMFDET